MIFDQPGGHESVTQGDILDNCPWLYWQEKASGGDLTATESVSRVVVLTQACDMSLGKANHVLVAAVHAARILVEKGVITAKLVREQIRTHRVCWYFLPAGSETEESIVDLRNMQTVPRIMLDRLAREGKRVCRIKTPYREHMAQHFSTTYSRIGLPEPYPSEPE